MRWSGILFLLGAGGVGSNVWQAGANLLLAVDRAQQIINKITSPQVNIAWQTDRRPASAGTTHHLRSALKLVNLNLQCGDLPYLHFSGAALRSHWPNTITITVQVGSSIVEKDIMVYMQYATAADVAAKINQKYIDISWQPSPLVSNVNTMSVIKITLQEQNAALSSDDLARISLRGGSLISQKSVPVTAIIHPKSSADQRASCRLRVRMSAPTAQNIIDKITEHRISLPRSNPSLQSPTAHLILRELRMANPALTRTDITKIRLMGSSLKPGAATPIIVKVIVNNGRDVAVTKITVFMQ